MNRIYKNYMIHECARNSAGMRYFAFGNAGTLKAQSLLGIKTLITIDKLKG